MASQHFEHVGLVVGIFILVFAISARLRFAAKIAKQQPGKRHAIQGLLTLAVLTAGAVIYHSSSLSN